MTKKENKSELELLREENEKLKYELELERERELNRQLKLEKKWYKILIVYDDSYRTDKWWVFKHNL